MRFAHPLALLAGLALPWFWWIATRRRPAIERTHVTWRIVTALLFVLAAAGVAVTTGIAPITVMAILDRSASIPSRAQQRALARVTELAQTMPAGDRLGLIALGASAAVEIRPSEKPRIENARAAVDDTGTNIAAAIQLAMTALPSDGTGRIVLISDGRETIGNSEREALLAGAAKVRLDVITPVTEGIASPLRVTRVVAPSDVRVGEPYLVSVEVAGTPGARGSVTLYRNDLILERHPVAVAADGTAGFVVSERQTQTRAFVYRAGTETEDTDDLIRARGAVVVVAGSPSLLYVSTAPPALGTAFAAAGFRIDQVAPAQVPDSSQGLSAYSGVVLDDIASGQLSTNSLEALSSYVENNGGGLLILGGARTLDAGGYPATPLARVLPIDLRPRAGQRVPSVDLILVFDKSGSMADVSDGVPKIEVARQAVMRAVDVMPESDGIGVLAFNAAPEVVAPLTHTRDVGTLRSALQRVVPGGSTAIAPAIETAFAWLQGPGATQGTRHQILLISDGRSSDADSARLRELARSGVAEISVVAVGPSANKALLEAVASTSGGRAYFPESLSELPQAVAREAARSSGGGVVQERFIPRPSTHAALTGIGLTSLPSLNGYVVGATKPAAVAILRSHLDDPVLAAWRAGLGRVAVYTADLRSPWSANLRTWQDGARFWAQTMRWVSRRDIDTSLQVAIRDGDRGPRIEVDTIDAAGRPVDFNDVSALVQSPAGANEELLLTPTSPGHYEAPIPVSGEGPYIVAISARETGTGVDHRLVRAVYWSADLEGLTPGNDLNALSRLSALTGGRLLTGNENPFEGERPRGYRDISAVVAAVALAMFVLDVVVGGKAGANRLRRLSRQRSAPAQKPAAA